MEYELAENQEENYPLLLQPADWFPKLISLQVDLIYNSILFLTSPIFFLLSIASDSYHRAEKTAETLEMTIMHKVPSKFTHGSAILLKKIGLGILGAFQISMVMVFLLVLAAVLGVGLVQMYVEEPVIVRERLFFDYTDANPNAVFSVAGVEVATKSSSNIKRKFGIPIGHTYHVSLQLLMPESDFNREIGVFQLTAEILSMNGNVIGKFSQPCMLRFRSLPVRLTRTFLMGIPLLLGISDETQKITIKILRHKEGNQRSGAIRVIMSPRAGTSSLPQLYEAEILLNSQLPWTKEIVHNWKWTFYVWTSLYIYILLIIILIIYYKPLIFPLTADNFRDDDTDRSIEKEMTLEEELKAAETKGTRYEKETPESLRRWQIRGKRKAIYLQDEVVAETIASPASASSMKIRREDTSTDVEEDIGDSESFSLGSST